MTTEAEVVASPTTPEAAPETVAATESPTVAEVSRTGEAAPRAAPAEPEKFEDVWRPRRHQRSEHRDAARRDMAVIAASLVNLELRPPQRPQSLVTATAAVAGVAQDRRQISGKISVRIAATGHAMKTVAAKAAATGAQGKTTRTGRAVIATIAIGDREKAAGAKSRADLRR